VPEWFGDSDIHQGMLTVRVPLFAFVQQSQDLVDEVELHGNSTARWAGQCRLEALVLPAFRGS
jgi:hypothetical protein